MDDIATVVCRQLGHASFGMECLCVALKLLKITAILDCILYRCDICFGRYSATDYSHPTG